MSEFIDLDRRFSRQSETQIHGDDAELVSAIGTLSWADLLAAQRVIVLAGARSGKTEELKHAVEQLLDNGKLAYFIPLNELVQSDLTKQCAPRENEFKHWQRDAAGGPAWFMIDARDELAISGRHLRIALTHLREGLGAALARARIILTSRPSDWHSTSDLRDFKDILAVPPQHLAAPIPDPMAGSDSTVSIQSADVVETPDNPLLLVKMAHLTDAAIGKLSRAWGVVDEEAFRFAVERSDVMWLARRPGDLLGLVRLWLADGELGNYEQVLNAIIDQSLDESREIPDASVELTRHQYRAGVARLAAALAWCQSHAYMQEEDAPQPAPSTALAAGQVFPDHPRAVRRALLRTAFFDSAHYGYIRFHSRPIREYLAACWVNGMELNGGLSQRDIHTLLFRSQYGELVVIPALRPVAAWLALRHRSVQELIYKLDPAILLMYGDPTQLETGLKEALLTSAVDHALEHGAPASDPRALRALGGVEMIPAIAKEWERLKKPPSGDSWKFTDDARMLVLHVIELGRHQAHAEIARVATTAPTKRHSLQMSALVALLAIGKEDEIRRAVKTILMDMQHYKQQFILFSAQRLYPKYLSTAELLAALKVKDDDDEEINLEPKWSLDQIIKSTEQAHLLEEILVGLGALRQTQVSVSDDNNPAMDDRTAIRWIPASIIEVAEALLRINPAVRFTESTVVAVLWALQRSDRNAGGPVARSLLEAIARSYGREQLTWLAFKQFDSWHRSYGVQSNEFTRLSRVDMMLQFGPEDLDWILSPVNAEPKNLRMLAALRAWSRAEEAKSQVTERLRTFAGNDADLIRMIDGTQNPVPDPETREYQKEARKWARRREAQQKKEQLAWETLKTDLRANPTVLAAADQTTTDSQFRRLWSLRYIMDRAKGKTSSVFSLNNWQDLEPELGAEVAQAAVVGFKNYWRTITSELPSELPPNAKNSTKYSTLISLTGLAIEASLDPDWSAHLTHDEAVKALRHGIRELNGFPSWFAEVAMQHLTAAFNLLEAEIHAELAATDASQHPNILSRLAYEMSRALPGLCSLILACLKTGKVTSERAFEYAVDILTRATATEAADVVRFAKQQLRLKTLSVPKKADYIFVLLCMDLTDGEASLRKVIQATTKKDRQALVQLAIARISGARRHRSISLPLSANIPTLKRLVDLSYRYILRAKDLEHKRVYSPGLRDHAQDGRNLLVRALIDAPGQEAYQALLDLTKKPHMKSDSVWLAESARRKAREDADNQSRWVAGNIPAYEESRVREPRNSEQLLELALRRLEEIGEDLRNGDFSLKDLLDSKASKEVHCQRWLAEQLRLRAKGLYSVTREPAVVNEKKPDIVLRGRYGAFSLPIEVKVANGLTGEKLREALVDQLIGQYMLDQFSTHGLLVVFGKDRPRKDWEVRGKRTKRIGQLASLLSGVVNRQVRLERRGMGARVFALDLG